MLTLDNNSLTIRFPEIHPDAVCHIEFQRTLRIPDDNRTHHLPPGLGQFPLSHVDDFSHKLPLSWQKRGGVFLPMHETEAMWIRFHSKYPFAVKVAAGKINAVTGKAWSTALHGKQSCGSGAAEREQDYLAVPRQLWLDGFCVEKGKIRQFVAMPLGAGYTVEEQLTGEAVHGGLQLIVYPLKAEFYEPPQRRAVMRSMAGASSLSFSASCASREVNGSVDMGMAPGGLMEQSIIEDGWGVDKFDQSVSAKCFVHLLNSKQFEVVTGKEPPHAAPSAADYTKNGLPWFSEGSAGTAALPGSPALQKLDSVANLAKKLGKPLADNEPLAAGPVVIKLKTNQVREGDF